MKRYTIKNLPPSTQNETEDIRLTFTKSRSTFLWCAFKDLLLNETLAMRIIIVILVIGAIGLVALAYPEKSIVCLIALLIYYGRYIWAINKVYSMYKEGDTFPMLTFYGPQNTMSVEEGERYVRLESPTWEEVERICFYHDCLVVEMNKKSEYGLLFMWTNDMEKAQQTALQMWRNALDAKASNTKMPEFYSETEVDEISDFIENTFGNYEFVLHEIVSPDIHVDIAIIPPTEERNYYTLCTMGVGAHRMNVPDTLRYESLLAERVELLMYLPADWNLSEEASEDERNYWPIRLLKDFARMPIYSDSWMGWGHSFGQEEVELYAEGVPYSAAVLLAPQPDIDNFTSCPLTVGKTVDFFQVFPLTHEELEYKMKCAEDDDCESPTDMLLDHIHADREHWMDYALSRFDYREKK